MLPIKVRYRHQNPRLLVASSLCVTKGFLVMCVYVVPFCLFLSQHYLDPPARLHEAMVNHGLNPDLFFTLHHGESQLIDNEDTHSSS
uniref:Uncharacterized protein n=1 Tax=Sinocyclocheilus grahami TaxID=75366 RepID=A0A672NVE6_SINGR